MAAAERGVKGLRGLAQGRARGGSVGQRSRIQPTPLPTPAPSIMSSVSKQNRQPREVSQLRMSSDMCLLRGGGGPCAGRALIGVVAPASPADDPAVSCGEF